MKAIRSLYLSQRFFNILWLLCMLFVLAYLLPLLFPTILFLFYGFIIVSFVDGFLLYRIARGVHGYRSAPDKLSNGDENPISIYVENFFPYSVQLKVIDELPHQFQRRDLVMRLILRPAETKYLEYELRPTKRGEYHFGALNVLTQTQLGLITRKFKFSQDKMVPVYPSFLQMRKYELMAISNNLTEFGIKKIRRIGHNMEFEQIKEYVQGDDLRTINWKATARRGQLMVNNYQDEKSQQVYSLIDKGRVMQLPFEGLSLLDYAINASLVISNIAIKKEDKAGLITFQHKVGTVLPASKRNNQMFLIQEALFNQKTAFKESDFSRLYSLVRQKINHRSLLLVFTNFESRVSLDRQLPYLVSLARNHVVVLIFFENTEMSSLIENRADSIRKIYHKAIAEKFAYEKKLITRELASYGIHSILTPPQELTVNTINKYLELKARGLV